MDTKTNFIKWIENQATSEDLFIILRFSNQNLGTKFHTENIIPLENPISKLINGRPSKDDLLNWLEDQNMDFLLKVALAVQKLINEPIWENIEEETFSTLISGIEDNHLINQEILQRSIKNCFKIDI